MGTIGQRLRDERESRGLKRVDVAKAIKVGAHHLAALEHDDFDALPEDVFAKGYVRTYAEHLGLDVEEVLADFARELETHRPAPSEDGKDPVVEEMSRILGEAAKSRGATRGRARLVGGVVLVVVLALAGWWWLGSEDRTGSAPVGARDPSYSRASLGESEPVEPPPVAVAPVEPASQSEVREVGSTPRPGTETPESAAPSDTTGENSQEEPQTAASAAGNDLEGHEPVADAATRLTVPEFGVGTSIENRRLVGQAEEFAEGTHVWFWTRVLGGAEGEKISHVWIHEDRLVGTVELKLGGPHWRTQSRKTLFAGYAGRWAVEARDEAGNVLARSEFTCTPSPDLPDPSP